MIAVWVDGPPERNAHLSSTTSWLLLPPFDCLSLLGTGGFHRYKRIPIQLISFWRSDVSNQTQSIPQNSNERWKFPRRRKEKKGKKNDGECFSPSLGRKLMEIDSGWLAILVSTMKGDIQGSRRCHRYPKLPGNWSITSCGSTNRDWNRLGFVESFDVVIIINKGQCRPSKICFFFLTWDVVVFGCDAQTDIVGQDGHHVDDGHDRSHKLAPVRSGE